VMRTATGNAGAPAFSFGGDPDTGFYRSSANEVSLSLGGAREYLFRLNGADGDFHATGDVIAYSSTASDIRLKENVENLELGLETIMKLRPVSYDWKHKEEKDKKDYGLIAQEVEKVLPILVKEKPLLYTGEMEIFKTLSYERLIPILIKSIQELSEEINKLKNQ